jgi:hypothetical protein
MGGALLLGDPHEPRREGCFYFTDCGVEMRELSGSCMKPLWKSETKAPVGDTDVDGIIIS